VRQSIWQQRRGDHVPMSVGLTSTNFEEFHLDAASQNDAVGSTLHKFAAANSDETPGSRSGVGGVKNSDEPQSRSPAQ